MPVSDKEIIQMFQRYLASKDPSEIDKLDVRELATTEARLTINGTNQNFTAVMKSQVAKLEQQENRKHESKIRAWNLITGLLLGLVTAGVSTWLFGT
ncbi:hypothetical protein [Thiomicrorhabdus lithotrophica]|uniref:Transcriptional activator TraM n=1 Tax=Thiomicrorhabdus lithotrophica TaxID=2949997 RepID=A0ABY8CBW3_9GAMM|nr:hypothetical protein [Thiomicrorhabdus lithotrophica]WEJ63474.1 hypothetical protein NR989_04280 [Thiomicrorhabdus lithotrophica]